MKTNKTEVQKTNGKKIGIVLSTILFLLVLSLITAFFLSFSVDENQNGNVAKIKLSGTITTEKTFSDIDSEQVVTLIKKANDNPQIKAILFEINSPGGSAVGSYEIADAIKQSNKTTVALIREAGASGGYWIATSTNHIIANPLSITGSIGVYGSFLEFSGLMNKYNVTYNRITYGEYKDMGSPFKKMTEPEKKKFQSEVDIIGDYFVAEVAKNRNLSYEYVKNLSTGEIFTGIHAKKLGLVDELGSFNEAEKYLKINLNVSEIEYVEYKTDMTFMDLLTTLSNNFGFRVGEGIGNSIKKDNAAKVRT